MTVVLIGFMGSGKSRVGRELARLLSCPLVDLDERIEEGARCSIPELFRAHGEEAFRAIETLQLQSALDEEAVVATGGGVITRRENRELLRESQLPVVWLQTSPQVLAARIRSEPGARPLIDGGGLLNLEQTTERVRMLLGERVPFYAECATLQVLGDDLEPDEIAREIVSRLPPST